jgi:1-acyl-sn-glycerol-3-phosphate acyltransferase
MAMKITVIGLGYLGATHAIAMAELGHDVIGIEANPQRLTDLMNGRIPFHEPGLPEALAKVLAKGNIKFKADHDEESLEADLHFLCVGTPQLPGSYAANTEYLESAVKALSPFLREDAVIAGKSTVPVGTSAALTKIVADATGFTPHLAWNPEFLREGTALEDSLRPDRIVIGVNDERSEEVLRKVYESITDLGTPFLVTDIPTAELVKVAANSFLATKISFINAMAEIAEVSGADAVKLAEAIGYDERIGNKFLRTGIGFGGGCLLSFSDSIFLPLMATRPVVFLAKSDYFTGKGIKGALTRWFFKATGQLPIDRSGGKASEASLNTGLGVLEQGQVLGIYPEGTRSPDGRLYRGRTGIARMVLEAKVPVIPVAMIDTEKVQPIGKRLPRIRRVGIVVGKPLDFSRFEGMEGDRVVLRAVTDEIMYELMKLSGQEYVDAYASSVKEKAARLARA